MAAEPLIPSSRPDPARDLFVPSPDARMAAVVVARRRQATRKARSGVPPNAFATGPWRRSVGGRGPG